MKKGGIIALMLLLVLGMLGAAKLSTPQGLVAHYNYDSSEVLELISVFYSPDRSDRGKVFVPIAQFHSEGSHSRTDSRMPLPSNWADYQVEKYPSAIFGKACSVVNLKTQAGVLRASLWTIEGEKTPVKRVAYNALGKLCYVQIVLPAKTSSVFDGHTYKGRMKFFKIGRIPASVMTNLSGTALSLNSSEDLNEITPKLADYVISVLERPKKK